ncbi:hypothetical protein THASP1DRAFT_28294 [Thamnocephalis sphaerospora]|uniref:RING-type domain-containing protein n=1 Tax=Thamnocephalis sphaerospora TaxID=78915 RepID=A0A4P9XWF4_9FUNG|nr:hypothetical protein THASP1DRAFT_28294 [Thamnocephalis sphaerospora]|eukprot:RKP09931.1 hypothetical protein THASP1DRAFT_28294 [Thamnocephalis sphaerospora]
MSEGSQQSLPPRGGDRLFFLPISFFCYPPAAGTPFRSHSTETPSVTPNGPSVASVPLDANAASPPNEAFAEPLLVVSVSIDADGRVLLHFIPAHANNETSLQGQPPAAEKAISALPTPTLLDNSEACVICQETLGHCDVKDGTATAVCEMPCEHRFHRDCLAVWLRRSNTCPCCRWELDTDNPEYNAGVRRRMTERLASKGKLPCALASIGICSHTGLSYSDNNSSTQSTPMAVMPQCLCAFHPDCVACYLRIEGYALDTAHQDASTTTCVRCPKCRQSQSVDLRSFLAA